MVIPALVSFALTLLLVPAVIAGLRALRIFDEPSARSLHDRPTLRGGGLAIAVGMLAALAFAHGIGGTARAALIVAAGGLGIVGLAEDLRGVAPLWRLLLQTVVAVGSVPLLLDGIDETTAVEVAVGVVTVVFVVGFANAFNFMDGINGLAVAEVLIAGATWWVVGRTQGVSILSNGGAIAFGGALAFAPANFPTARVFLGDVGSYFLGGWLAAVATLALRAGLPPEVVLGPLVVFAADTGTTLIRRILQGKRWYEPHREHTFQLVVGQGWSNLATVLLVAGAIASCSLLGSVSLSGDVGPRVVADVVIGAVLAGYLTAPRWLNRLGHQEVTE
jgi:UDP-GlcNAc:undecaprenyl-phosphate/decaprenyl-phosphate GlcNAc-1-phosphate transferase